MGRSRGGLTTRFHAFVDADGRPIALKLTERQAHDGRNADDMLETALLNLSVNARDAISEGGTLRISTTPETVRVGQVIGLKPSAYVKPSVADTGVAMDEATLARAIEPFSRRKVLERGTGLGLSMVHGSGLPAQRSNAHPKPARLRHEHRTGAVGERRRARDRPRTC